MTRTDKIVNRHMARLLDELEQAHCPVIYRDAIKRELVWLRDDLRGEGDAEKDVDRDCGEW